MWWIGLTPSGVAQITQQIVKAIDEDMPLSVVLTPDIKGVEVRFWNGAKVAKAGCYVQLPKPVGIKINAEVVVPTGGTLKFVQNVMRTGTRFNSDDQKKECLSQTHKGQWMLDDGDPYQGKLCKVPGPGKAPAFFAVDSPGQCLSDPKLEKMDIDETFRTYLMWKAKPRKNKKTKGSSGWNVIGCVEWSWSGNVTATGDALKPGVVCGISSGGNSYRWKKLNGNSSATVVATTTSSVLSPVAVADDWSPCP